MTEKGTIAYVSELKDCDYCKESVEKSLRPGETALVRKAEYDFKTAQGPWAYGCSVHWIMHRMFPTLGVGKGQKLEVHPTPGESDPKGQS